MFVILKVFFFPDFLKGKTAEEKQELCRKRVDNPFCKFIN